MAGRPDPRVGDIQVLLRQSLAQQEELRRKLEDLQVRTDATVQNLQNDLRAARRSNDNTKEMHLVDMKTMSPTSFGGTKSELYKPWAKKVKAFCNTQTY